MINPLDPPYNAAGDGTTDDLAAINAAAAAAAAGGDELIFPAGYTFAVSGYIIVENGVKVLRGLGGIIKLTAPGGIRLKGIHSSAAANVKDLLITGLILDANDQLSNGIDGENVSRVRIVRNVFRNFSVPGSQVILLMSWADGVDHSEDNVVECNEIDAFPTIALTGAESGQGAVVGIGIGAGSTVATGALDYWKANGTNLPIALPIRRTKIRFNSVNGGYYGVSLSGAQDCIVVGNSLRNNMRNISVQNSSLRNKIAGNALDECFSSSVLLAWGSSDNDISGNFIRSARALGEAILNNYIGCTDNRFHDNVVEIVGDAAAPAFFCYAGVHASRVEFARNTLSGQVSRAGITVESAWNTAIVYPYSHAKGQPSYLNGFATEPTDGIVIRDNRLTVTTPRPGIALIQAGDGAGGYALTNTIVDGNIVEGDSVDWPFYIWEDNGSCSGVRMRDNKFDPSYTAAMFAVPRGWAHFADRAGNATMDRNATPIAFANADTTPSVGVGQLFVFANAGATSVTNFDDGGDGQEILIRGDGNTTLIHNASLLKLKGAVNVAPGVDGVLRLRRIGGVWIEIARNF